MIKLCVFKIIQEHHMRKNDFWHGFAYYGSAFLGVAACELSGFLDGPSGKVWWYHALKLGLGTLITLFSLLKDDEIILPSPKVQSETPEQKQLRIIGMKNNFRRRIVGAFAHGIAWPTSASIFANLIQKFQG